MRPLKTTRTGPLRGKAQIPGDKSISHRTLIIGSLAVGRSEITGLLQSTDVLASAAAMQALGATITHSPDGKWLVDGVGVGGLMEPKHALDFGNSGTGSRLIMGVTAGHPITAAFVGDASLSQRPMGRILKPLIQMGTRVQARAGDRLPLTITGASPPLPITYQPPVASAQVKSAILFAALNTPGKTTVIEPLQTRDHTERLLKHAGAQLTVEPDNGGAAVTITGETELQASKFIVPGDPSSVAFPLIAALLVPDSEITFPGIMVNPLRTGLLDTLLEMGAEIAITNQREEGGEPIADLLVKSSALRGVDIPPERVPSMIDEFPILAIAAAFADGKTTMRGLAELRVKETDRVAAIAHGLIACGAKVEESEDDLTVHGMGPGGLPGGARVKTELDHRIAMSFLVAGLATKNSVIVDDTTMIDTSFPGFVPLMENLGAAFVRLNA